MNLHLLLPHDRECLVGIDLMESVYLNWQYVQVYNERLTRGGPTAMPTEAAVESHEGGMVVESWAGEECDSPS